MIAGSSSWPAARVRDRAGRERLRVGFDQTDPARISARDWEELARDCRLDPDETIARVRAMADSLLAVLSDVVVNAAQQWDSHVPGLLAPRLEDHLRACRERL
jgi:hypothetical protein